MKRYDWNALSGPERRTVLARPADRSDPIMRAQVRDIVDDVRARGWDAAVDHAIRLDRAPPLRHPVGPAAAEARKTLTGAQKQAIRLAHRNLTAFHAATLPPDQAVETYPGLIVRKLWRPIDRVGLYVPGGATPLFSTLLMLAIPAAAAGVQDIVVVTPPRPGGGLDPVVALVSEMCGIDAVWTIGGAQAIGALAWGAGDIPAVPKICGPGNAWVAEAKAYVASLPGGPAIDLPAGPSELLVIADAAANPGRVAADLLSQAEHDVTAQVFLLSDSPALVEAVAAAVAAQAGDLPRAAVAAAALDQGRLIVTATLDEAVAVANAYAPEHLSLAVAHPDILLPFIRNAGAVFAGGCAAETFGDYLAGSSHVLPTDGTARVWSGVSTHSFMKAMTVQSVTPAAARRLAGPAAALARLEGLEAHARAADARREAA